MNKFLFLYLLYSFNTFAIALDPLIATIPDPTQFGLIDPGFSCLNNELETINTKFFSCTPTKTASGCEMALCSGKIPGYPQAVTLYIPKEPNRFSVHFHGHILGVYPEYEKDGPSMVKAMKIEENLCSNHEISIFPKSVGSCKTYDEYFSSPQAFNTFMQEISDELPTSLKDKNLPVTISAHSGGGRSVSRILNGSTADASGDFNQRIDHAVLYDGIYSSWQTYGLSNWVTSNKNVKLQMVAQSPNTTEDTAPFKYSTGIFNTIAGKNAVKVTDDLISNKRYEHRSYTNANGSQVELLTRPIGSGGLTFNHYQVMNENWDLTHQEVAVKAGE